MSADAGKADDEAGDLARVQRLLQHPGGEDAGPERHGAADDGEIARRQHARRPRDAQKRQHIVVQADDEVVAPVLAQRDALAHGERRGNEEQRAQERAAVGDRAGAEDRHAHAQKEELQGPEAREAEEPGPVVCAHSYR